MPLRGPLFLIIAELLILLTLAGFSLFHSTGYVGGTLKSGTAGCVCHGDHVPTDTVIVWVTGPESLRLGGIGLYTVHVKGGPAVAGGYNVAAGSGALSAFDTTSYLLSGELTHTAPKPFRLDTVEWQFFYRAPVSGAKDTIYSVGNSTNLNGAPTGDEFNFGQDFVVRLIDTTLDAGPDPVPAAFRLDQNYPNPFNPSTTIGYSLAVRSFVTLRVTSVLGNEVARLVAGSQQAGEHSVVWDASNVASGVYFLRLEAVSQDRMLPIFHDSRKMVVVR